MNAKASTAENAMSDLAREYVVCQLWAELPSILDGGPVRLAYLHGSVAEGCPLPFSDVDLALVLAPGHGLSPYQRLRLELDIAAKLEARCGWKKVDVRSINDAPVMVQGTVLTEGVRVYSADEEFRVEYEPLTWKRYFDFLPVAHMMRRAYFERLRSQKASANDQSR